MPMTQEGFHCFYWFIILIDYFLKMDEKVLPQVFLDECKHSLKEKELKRNVVEDVCTSLEESDEK